MFTTTRRNTTKGWVMSAVALLIAAALLFWAVGASAQSPRGEERGMPRAERESRERVPVLIMFNQDQDVARAPGLLSAHGGEVTRQYSIVPAVSAELPRAAIEVLERNPRIEVVEEDLEFELHSFPNELANSWGVQHIGAGIPHQNGVRGNGVKVAIIDSGIDSSHPDLAVNVAGGFNFVSNNSNFSDTNGHGTHVAGIVGAVRNGVGVVGVAPEVDLYALKVGETTSVSFSAVVAALDWAVANGIQVTNSSFGSTGHPGFIVQAAYDNSYNAGIVHVASSGNTLPNGSSFTTYPARFGSVIGVGATTQNNSLAFFSNYGFGLELMAPGTAINSTVVGGGYGLLDGTSMAAPHVAGVAALVIGSGVSSPAQVRSILQSTAQNIGGSFEYGYGLVRADLAVAAAQGGGGGQPSTTDISVSSMSVASSATVGDSVPVSVTVQNVGSTNVTSNITVSLVNQTTGQSIGSQTISGGLNAGASATRSFNWNTTGLSAGSYTLRASHNISDDNSSNNQRTATVTLTAPSGGGGTNAMGVQQMVATQGWFGPTVSATIRRDSNNDGQLTTADAVVSSASVQLRIIRDANGDGIFDCSAGDQCWNYTLLSNFSGQISQSILFAPSGNYKAEIVELTHGSFTWNPSLDNQNPIFFTR